MDHATPAFHRRLPFSLTRLGRRTSISEDPRIVATRRAYHLKQDRNGEREQRNNGFTGYGLSNERSTRASRANQEQPIEVRAHILANELRVPEKVNHFSQFQLHPLKTHNIDKGESRTLETAEDSAGNTVVE